MKPLLSVLIGLVGAMTLQAAEWRELKTADGKFQVEFPGKPEHTSREWGTDTFRSKSHTYVVQLNGQYTYAVSTMEVPHDVFQFKSVDEVLDDGIAEKQKMF